MVTEQRGAGLRQHEVDTNTTVRGFLDRQIAQSARDRRGGPHVKLWDGPWRLLGPWWVRYWRWSNSFEWEPRRYDALYIGGQS